MMFHFIKRMETSGIRFPCYFSPYSLVSSLFSFLLAYLVFLFLSARLLDFETGCPMKPSLIFTAGVGEGGNNKGGNGFLGLVSTKGATSG